MACSTVPENVDSNERLRGWGYVWTAWGVICAASIYWIDRTVVQSLVWVPVGMLIGRFGLPIVFRIFEAVMGWQSKIFGARKDLPEADETQSYLAYMTDHLVTIASDKKLPWEIYLPTIIFFGIVWGIGFGPIFGAWVPVSEDLPMTAFCGALCGLVVGPVVVGLIPAILMPPTFWCVSRGPAVEGIRPIVQRAVAEAERLRHEEVTPGHLLFALIDQPEGAVEALLAHQKFDAQEIDDSMRSAIQQDFAEEWNVPDLYETISVAVSEAKTMKQRSVEPGHLLLGLLTAWPVKTLEILEQMGLDPSQVRANVIAQLQAGK